MKNIIIIVLAGLIVIGIGIGFFVWSSSGGTRTEITHSSVVEKIETIGKLELVKITIQEILEYDLVRNWRPDSKAILIIQGEAVGCIDMEKIKPENIYIKDDSLSIKLPAPEIAYCKVNHERSRVYDTKHAMFSGANIIDEAYKSAEKQLEKTVYEVGILEQTKKNADLFFNSFF
jgi:hypothetical protein